MGETEKGRMRTTAASPVLPFFGSPVLPFSHSPILPFSHSPIPPFPHSPIPPFPHSRHTTTFFHAPRLTIHPLATASSEKANATDTNTPSAPQPSLCDNNHASGSSNIQ